MASMVFIYINIVWVGIVRPILFVLINLWVPLKSHSHWCERAPPDAPRTARRLASRDHMHAERRARGGR